MIEAFLTWQSGVLVVALAICAGIEKRRPSRHALLALLCYGASVFLFNAWVFTEGQEYRFKVFNAGINGALVVYLGALFYFLVDPPERNDLPVGALWFIVLFAEAWSLVFNNIGCNLILETATMAEQEAAIAAGASKYVCGREIGEWFEWTPIMVEIGFMIWIIRRWQQVYAALKDN